MATLARGGPPTRLVQFALATALAVAMGCRQGAASLGADRREARARADELLGALERRFGAVERDRAFEAIRPRLARAALVPSRLFKDPTAWTGTDGPVRTLVFAGRPGMGRYRLSLQADALPPQEAGTYRGVLHLQSVGPGEFEWTMRDELAVGAIRPDDLARALTAVMREAEAVPVAAASSRLREELPRTARALAPLFSLTLLRLAPAEAGGTAVVLGFELDADAPRSPFPKYARYLRKYFAPMRLQVAAFDESGAKFWELGLRDGRGTLRLRVHSGSVVALEGPLQPVPDVLRVRTDVSVKSGLFRVGAGRLEAEIRLTRAPADKSFVATFRAEPDWELPFFVEPLLRAPLRRPFRGDGARLGFALRESGNTTLVTRDYRVAVRESWIVRWLGGLGSDAVGEFQRGAEEEADRFFGMVLGAFRADVLALIDHPAGTR